MRLLIVALLALMAVSAAEDMDYMRILDIDVGFVEVAGFSAEGEHLVLNNESVRARAMITQKFLMENYSVKITPRNIEHIAEDLGIPLSDSVNREGWPGAYEGYNAQIPEIACGTYKVTGEAYYTVENITKKIEDEIKVKVPCKSFQSRIVSGLVSFLPYSILKGLMNLLGIKITI